MSILIQKQGFLDTFQDLGRNGFRQLGINPTGAMDRTAVRLINILLGNEEAETVLEMHFPACEIKFVTNAIFAIGGAEFGAKLNDKLINNWQIQTATKDDILKFAKKSTGNRCYLAIRDGFKLEKWLGSSSTNLIAETGGFMGRKLVKGDCIKFNSSFRIQDSSFKIQASSFKLQASPSNLQDSKLRVGQSIIPHYSKSRTVRIIAGAEYQDLTALSEQEFLSNNFKISNDSNRMGFRLSGKPLYLLSDKEIVSSAVNFGTLQLLPDDQLIILMADHQTTGGYPRIGHIIEQDLPLVAQLGANDSIGFHIISNEEAENLKIEFEKDLKFLEFGIKCKNY